MTTDSRTPTKDWRLWETLGRWGRRHRGRPFERQRQSLTDVGMLVRRTRNQALGFVAVSVTASAALNYGIFVIVTGPGHDTDLDVWWEWLRSTGQAWDPTSSLALLAAITLPLFLTTFVGRSGRQRSDSDHDVATVIGLETVTLLICFAAAVVTWMLVPVAAGTATAVWPKIVIASVIGTLFCALAALANPSDEARRHFVETEQRRERELQRMRRHYEDLLRPSMYETVDGHMRLPGRGSRFARRNRLWLAGFGAMYGLVTSSAWAVIIALTYVASWQLGAVVVACCVLDAFLAVWIGSQRPAAYVNRIVVGRWSNLGENVVTSTVALTVGGGGVVLALNGFVLTAALFFAVFFGPGLLYHLSSRTVLVESLRYCEVRRRLSFTNRYLREQRARLGGSSDVHI